MGGLVNFSISRGLKWKTGLSVASIFCSVSLLAVPMVGASSNVDRVAPKNEISTGIPDLNLQVDLTRAISSAFTFKYVNCLAGRVSFPTVSSIARSLRSYPERWSKVRRLVCRPRARINPYTFTIFGTASSTDAQLTDGSVVTRCSFGADVSFRMTLDIGTQVSDLVRMNITDGFKFPVTCAFRISSLVQTFTVTGNFSGIARVDASGSNCVPGIRACAPFAVSGAGVTVTSTTGKYSGSVAVGTFNHADIIQLPELVQLSYLVDTARVADVVASDVAPVEIVDVPPAVSSMELRFLLGTTTSTLLRPVSPVDSHLPKVPIGGDISVSTGPGTVCRLTLTWVGRRVALDERTATSLGLATWLISTPVRERIARVLDDEIGPIDVVVLAVCTTIDSRMVMTLRAVLE